MPEDTRRKVLREAKREGKSFSATATELIEKQLGEHGGPSPFEALIGAISDPRLQACEMDEVLKERAADGADRGGR